MELFKGHNDFCNVEAHGCLREMFFLVKMREQFTALNESQDKIKLCGRLESIVKCRQERAIDDFLENLDMKKFKINDFDQN